MVTYHLGRSEYRVSEAQFPRRPTACIPRSRCQLRRKRARLSLQLPCCHYGGLQKSTPTYKAKGKRGTAVADRSLIGQDMHTTWRFSRGGGGAARAASKQLPSNAYTFASIHPTRRQRTRLLDFTKFEFSTARRLSVPRTAAKDIAEGSLLRGNGKLCPAE